MRKITYLIKIISICVVIVSLSIGCKSGPEPAPNQSTHRWAETQRSSIITFMNKFEKLVQEADYDAIMRSSVHRGGPFHQRHQVYKNIKRATWIPELTGYEHLNLDDVVRRLHWQHLTSIGQVSFSVEARCASGTVWNDHFELYRPEDDWLIASAKLRVPEPDQIVELQDNDAESILELAKPVLYELENGNIQAVQEIFPNTYESRFRVHRPNWLARIFMQSTRVSPIQDELEKLQQLNIETWPTPEQGLPARFAGDMSLYLTYVLPKNGNGSVQVRIFVIENQDREWELRMLRIDGVS